MKRRVCLLWGGTALWGLAGMARAQAFEDFQKAILRDDYLLMQRLLRKGLDPNTVDEQGRPALVRALQVDSLRVARELLRARSIKINAMTPQGENALMIACIKGHLDWVRRLVGMGADINKPGWAPLHYAASAAFDENLPILELLLDNHAYIDAESPNKSTPLMLAAQYGSEDMVRLLLKEGADPNLRNQQRLTAVDFAQRSEREFMVRLLEQAREAARPAKTSW